MRLNISVGIIAAIALLTPACGGSGGGGGAPLGGLEAETTADSLNADDLAAMCSSMGSKAATAIPNASDFDMENLVEPMCVLFAVTGFGDRSQGATTVEECNAFVTLCQEGMEESDSEGGAFGDLPTPAQASAEVNEDCLADDWSSCTATIDEITGCVNAAVASAKMNFAAQEDALTQIDGLTCTAAINSTEEELQALIPSDMPESENSQHSGPVASCLALQATCDNSTISTLAQLGSDGGSDDVPDSIEEGGEDEEWDGIPVISEQYCCDSQPAPGCDNTLCVECVCEEDSYCCVSAWDGFCSGIAAEECQDSCGCE